MRAGWFVTPEVLASTLEIDNWPAFGSRPGVVGNWSCFNLAIDKLAGDRLTLV